MINPYIEYKTTYQSYKKTLYYYDIVPSPAQTKGQVKGLSLFVCPDPGLEASWAKRRRIAFCASRGPVGASPMI